MIDPNQYINDPVYGRLMPNDTWKQYEGKPDLSNVPSEILRLVPKDTRDGRDTSGRIDSIIITNI